MIEVYTFVLKLLVEKEASLITSTLLLTGTLVLQWH